MSLLRTFSLTKWKSTSMCLVLAWKIELEAKASAETLSHHNIGG